MLVVSRSSRAVIILSSMTSWDSVCWRPHCSECILHQLSEIIYIQPDIVYVHVGENDLCSLHGSNVSPIMSHLCHIIDKLTPHTHIIFLSQLLLFPVYTHARKSVLSVNNNMSLCAARVCKLLEASWSFLQAASRHSRSGSEAADVTNARLTGNLCNMTLEESESAHSDDWEHASLLGIVLLVIAYFKDTVEDFFHVGDVILW